MRERATVVLERAAEEGVDGEGGIENVSQTEPPENSIIAARRNMGVRRSVSWNMATWDDHFLSAFCCVCVNVWCMVSSLKSHHKLASNDVIVLP